LEEKEESKAMGGNTEQLISFTVGEEDYGVEIQKVKEVIRKKEITRLPKTPPFLRGVINLRGDVIPIIDLREKFGLEQEEQTEMTRVIVVEVDDKSIGMVVDRVSHVIRLSRDDVDPPPPLVGGLSADYLRGVGKLGEKLIVLLDIDRILTEQEKVEIEGLEGMEEMVPA
jgi:purine-binding chemotaxis protein CheW